MIRRLARADIPRVLALTNSVGWSYDAADIERLMMLSPEGCLVAEAGGSPVGFASAMPYGSRGFIGNVVVEELRRKTSIGKDIVQEAIAHLQGAGALDIRLYSYTHTEGFYERLGFKPGAYLTTMKRTAGPTNEAPKALGMTDVQLSEVCAQDRNVWGADRSAVLKCHRNSCPELAMVAGKGRGYIFGRGSAASGFEIGPWVSRGGEGDALLPAFIGKAGGSEIWATCFEENDRAVQMLRSAGFAPSFRTREMALGRTAAPIAMDIMTVSGLELG